MSFQSYNELPDVINERLNAQEMLDVKREIQEQIVSFTDEQRKSFFSILEDIELRRSSVKDLLTMLQEKIPLDSDIEKKVALKLWSEYFFMVQDYYGSCIELINAHGGNSVASIEKAKSFLHPHRQMMKFIQRNLYEFFPERSEEYHNELIDQLIERALGKVRKQEVTEHFTLFFQSKGISGLDAGKLADAIELLVLSGAFSAQHAWYYLGLADTVINARPFIDITSINVPPIEVKQISPEEKKQLLEKQFEAIPLEVKEAVTSENARRQRNELEKKYAISLDTILMQAAVKEFPFADLAVMLHKELHLGPEKASALRDEIIKTFFEPVKWYFIKPRSADSTDLADMVIQKCAISLTEDLYNRVERTLIMRIKNSRTDSETHEKLTSEILQGGCGVTIEQADCLTKEAALIADEIQKGVQMVVLPVKQDQSLPIIQKIPPKRQQEPEQSKAPPVLQEPAKQEKSIAQTQPPKVEYRRTESYEVLADEVIQKCITSLSEDCTSRVRRALITRIRNIRTNIETREKLISEMSQGGCGITGEQAECLTKEAALLADEIQKGTLTVIAPLPSLSPLPSPPKLEPTAKPVEPLPPPEAPAALPVIEAAPLPQPPPTKIPLAPKPAPPPKPIESVKPLPTKPPVVQQKAPAGLAIEEVDGIPTFVENKVSSSTPPPRPAVQPVAKQESHVIKVEVRKTQTQPSDQKKLSITDIKKPPHLVGPIEELQSFTLKDFRRISANPIQAATRIFDKIQMLEKESLPKKMEAIAAWKRSEVNMLYIEIGKESFGKGMPIAAVIEQRKTAGKDFLTEAEFDALLDLNTMLRQ